MDIMYILYLVNWISDQLKIRSNEYPTWLTFCILYIQSTEYPLYWISGLLEICILDYPVYWMFDLLDYSLLDIRPTEYLSQYIRYSETKNQGQVSFHFDIRSISKQRDRNS